MACTSALSSWGVGRATSFSTDGCGTTTSGKRAAKEASPGAGALRPRVPKSAAALARVTCAALQVAGSLVDAVWLAPAPPAAAVGGCARTLRWASWASRLVPVAHSTGRSGVGGVSEGACSPCSARGSPSRKPTMPDGVSSAPLSGVGLPARCACRAGYRPSSQGSTTDSRPTCSSVQPVM